MRGFVNLMPLLTIGLAVGCKPAPAPNQIAVPALGLTPERPRVLATPTQVHVLLDGKPVNEVMYPFLGDIDADGKPDLLIGTRMKGRLLVYQDIRAATDHVLAAPLWFDDREPTGRIPSG